MRLRRSGPTRPHGGLTGRCERPGRENCQSTPGETIHQRSFVRTSRSVPPSGSNGRRHNGQTAGREPFALPSLGVWPPGEVGGNGCGRAVRACE